MIWILNVKLMHLVITDLETDRICLPPCTISTEVFYQSCMAMLQENYPHSSIRDNLEEMKSLKEKSRRKEIEKLVSQKPPKDTVMKWFFNLQLWERGERLEHWFFNQLHFKGDTLQDLVILPSLNFLTNE